MHRIHPIAIPLAAWGALALGCQPNTTQSEPPVEENAMENESPAMAADEAMPAEDETWAEEESDQPTAETPKPEPELSAESKTFIDEAAHANAAEVELSKVALEKTKTPAVREFAQKMVDDHTKVGTELASLGQQLGVDVPAELTAEVKQKKDELQKLEGKKLDDKYVGIMLEDHEKAVDLFDKESKNDKDPEVQAFAAKNLPTLKGHLEHVKAIKAGKPYRGPQAKADTKPADKAIAAKR